MNYKQKKEFLEDAYPQEWLIKDYNAKQELSQREKKRIQNC